MEINTFLMKNRKYLGSKGQQQTSVFRTREEKHTELSKCHIICCSNNLHVWYSEKKQTKNPKQNNPKQTTNNPNYFSLEKQQQHVLKKARERSHCSSGVLLRPMCIFRGEQATLRHFSKRQLTDNRISKHFIFSHCYKILSAPLNALRRQISLGATGDREVGKMTGLLGGTDIQKLQIAIRFHCFLQKDRLERSGSWQLFFILADKLIYEKFFKFLLYSYITPFSSRERQSAES